MIAKRSWSFFARSASISERIIFFAPGGILLSSAATTGSGLGVGSLRGGVSVGQVRQRSEEECYLGPDTDFDFPKNDSLFDPSLFRSTVFIRVINLFTPLSFFSSGPPFAGVLMIAGIN